MRRRMDSRGPPDGRGMVMNVLWMIWLLLFGMPGIEMRVDSCSFACFSALQGGFYLR